VNQRTLNLNATQIVSGSEIMTPGEGRDHTRLLWASAPPFATRPDVTLSNYSAEGMANPGTMFVPWSVEYVAPGGAGLHGGRTALKGLPPAEGRSDADTLVMSAALVSGLSRCRGVCE
jgi:hypothetical protein